MLLLISRYFMAALYVYAGILHFVKPKMYLKIMPPYMPAHLPLVYLSGLAEITLGLMLFVPATQVIAAWGIILLLLAVLPANIYMAQLGGAAFKFPEWVVWARLPLQLVLIAWAYVYTRV
jgi:uncharacterized membrane protein